MQPPRQVQPGFDITTWSNVKYAHGVELLHALLSSVDTWSAQGNVYAELRLAEDGLSGEASMVVHSEPPYESVAMLLGDALHNFRGALDTLAWELCHLDGNAPGKPEQVYFPIAKDEKGWKDKSKSLTSIPSEIMDRIYAVQPFLQPDPAHDILATVSRLSNFDKHRARVQSQAAVESFVVAVNMDLAKYPEMNDPIITIVASNTMLEDGQVILRAHFDKPVELRNPSGRSEIKLQYIVIDDEGRLELLQLCSGLQTGLRQVIDFVTFGGHQKPLGEVVATANFPESPPAI